MQAFCAREQLAETDFYALGCILREREVRARAGPAASANSFLSVVVREDAQSRRTRRPPPSPAVGRDACGGRDLFARSRPRASAGRDDVRQVQERPNLNIHRGREQPQGAYDF